MSTAGGPETITTDDLRAKFAELQGSATDQVDQAQSAVAMVAAGAIGALIVAAFVLGRRRGKKKQTVVEIRKI